jgi:calcineurin-like phosphoesterase family protein
MNKNKVYFTADLHFNHAKIIQYCSRPFNSIIDMNNTFINNWNRKVTNNDEIVINGDFAFCNGDRANELLRQLNGKKFLIIGNHDHFLKYKTFDKSLFEWIKDYYMLKTQYKGEKIKIVLSHYPFYRWDCKHHGSIHLYGHVHNTQLGLNELLGKAYNVGVDVNNYEPISLDEILGKLS